MRSSCSSDTAPWGRSASVIRPPTRSWRLISSWVMARPNTMRGDRLGQRPALELAALPSGLTESSATRQPWRYTRTAKPALIVP